MGNFDALAEILAVGNTPDGGVVRRVGGASLRLMRPLAETERVDDSSRSPTPRDELINGLFSLAQALARAVGDEVLTPSDEEAAKILDKTNQTYRRVIEATYHIGIDAAYTKLGIEESDIPDPTAVELLNQAYEIALWGSLDSPIEDFQTHLDTTIATLVMSRESDVLGSESKVAS